MTIFKRKEEKSLNEHIKHEQEKTREQVKEISYKDFLNKEIELLKEKFIQFGFEVRVRESVNGYSDYSDFPTKEVLWTDHKVIFIKNGEEYSIKYYESSENENSIKPKKILIKLLNREYNKLIKEAYDFA